MNQSNVKPLSDFMALFHHQKEELSPEELVSFKKFEQSPYTVAIRRGELVRRVYVVAASGPGVLYYDDVEDGFNISDVDDDGYIKTPGGADYTLREAVRRWFPIDKD